MEEKDKIVEICRLLTKKRSFAYKIGKTYFLTNGLFVRECDSEEKENLNTFLKVCESLNLTNICYEQRYNLGKNDIKKFTVPMKKLLNKAEKFQETDGCYELDEFLFNYSYSQLCELNHQVEIFEKAWFYKERYELFYEGGDANEKEK